MLRQPRFDHAGTVRAVPAAGTGGHWEIDLSRYKQQQLLRRLAALRLPRGARDLDEYGRRLAERAPHSRHRHRSGRVAVGRAEALLWESLRNVSPSRRRGFFTRPAPAADPWWIRPGLQSGIAFRRADPMRGLPDGRFDLIVCRNVAIYLTEEAKQVLLGEFARALRPGGALLLGASETIPRAAELELEFHGPSVYTHPASTRSTGARQQSPPKTADA